MTPLGDGVEWLLTLHTQGDFLLSDWSWSSFPQLHAALRKKQTDTVLTEPVNSSAGAPSLMQGLDRRPRRTGCRSDSETLNGPVTVIGVCVTGE